MNERMAVALRKIQEGIDCGESIVLARTKACGSTQGPFTQDVMHTQEYVDMLNAYQIKIGKRFQFKLEDGKLVKCSRKPKE